ncbi:MAG TPA: ribonuclease [Trinickia sp.]|jgi:ribonuclease T1|uniref:ribonuclease n=1 Tax=Trinickia sp. TaxID=2571163 RepID=UPI002B82CDC4|nr:ribonuclease [Trinickia sp.]HTI18790.1 ribonuclease [Trinickia sp.]
MAEEVRGKCARQGAAVAGGHRWLALIVAALLTSVGSISGSGWGLGGQAAFAREPVFAAEESGRVDETIVRTQLPREALGTLNLIAAGGPYPYSKDGAAFGNFERLLPPRPRGYYREYTVLTPRARNRGARRIVCGGTPRRTDNCFYSNDHYNSFKRIVE